LFGQLNEVDEAINGNDLYYMKQMKNI